MLVALALSVSGRSAPHYHRLAAPMLLPAHGGRMACQRDEVPADPACAPLGATYTITGCDFASAA